jgi:hypothetical protein
MKNEKKIEMPDDIDICDDCKEEYHISELENDTNLRTNVVGQYCKSCMELHINEE